MDMSCIGMAIIFNVLNEENLISGISFIEAYFIKINSFNHIDLPH